MAAEPRRAPIMTLQQLVAKYQSLAGGFGVATPLSGFGLNKAETEQLFTDYDEDYHISRFFDFTEADGEKFLIDGVPATHLAIDAEIQSTL
ncbi:MAG TPA: hypothetical protein VMP12_03670 [Candidatus Sulfotelmatobacter sp.]|jgi:hypothetical protein|nr:hypothetical protein [Candidatus Sulfotelmatobacter sp.]